MRVAIQGTHGSFHEQAAQELLGESVQIVACPTFKDVFKAVAADTAAYGLVAVENSLHGSINDVYRLLSSSSFSVVGEIFLRIEQYLLASPQTANTAMTSIQRVLSQEPALSQCEAWLASNLPNAWLEYTGDTAGSVEYVMQHTEEPLAAVAGKQAAELYGATIVAGPINDDVHNYTRFFLMSRTPSVADTANRTSIILETSHQPGALWRALGLFAEAGIDLSKLDSHPIASDKRHYTFYVDIEASQRDARVAAILQQLEDQACTVRILGSYQAGKLPV